MLVSKVLKKLALLCLLLSGLGLAGAAEIYAEVDAEGAPLLLILGDSLSDAYNLPREAGWAHGLAERLEGEMRVVNASISGDTTAGGLARLPDLLAEHQPSHLLLILGGNDGLRALSPAQLERNLGGIIALAQDQSVEVLLMQIRLPANLGPAYLSRFESVYPRLADQYGLPLLPFFLEDVFDQPGMIMDDGIHPSRQAQPKMLEALWSSLSPLLP